MNAADQKVNQAPEPDAQVTAQPVAVPTSAASVRPKVLTILAVAAIYWSYVTVSDILYAHSLSIGFSTLTTAKLLSPWTARAFQHAALFPVLASCMWLSLRAGWQPLWRAIPIQLLLAGAFAAAGAPALWLGESMYSPHEWMDWKQEFQHSGLPYGAIALWVASATNLLFSYTFGLAAINGFSWYQRYRDAELRVAALESAWHSARLAALRMQLSPHTLFNLLHTIRGQIVWDPRAAQSMVVQLADLLRRLLNAGERDFSRLADELQFVRLYLELQQRRFPDRLTIALPEPSEVPAVWVPSLILQPLAENAVVHGLAGHEAPVNIGLQILVTDETLTVRISNTVSPSRLLNETGIGLANVRERLEVQFGSRAHLSASMAGPGQWVSEVQLPALRESPSSRPGQPARETQR